MQCNPLYFRYTSGLCCNPAPLAPRQQYVLHRVRWPKAEACIEAVRYTSVVLFAALWDPRGPRIIPSFAL